MLVWVTTAMQYMLSSLPIEKKIRNYKILAARVHVVGKNEKLESSK